MKKTIVILGLLTVFASGWAFGQTRAPSLNGTFWRMGSGSSGLASAAKGMYVEGFSSGFMRGYFDGLVRGNLGHQQTPAEEKGALSFLSQDAPMISTFTTKHSSFPDSEVESEMDSFYSDYRNAAVCWGDAIIFSLGSLEGRPPTKEQLDKARVKGAKSSSCRFPLPSAAK